MSEEASLARLRLIKSLVDEGGINLAGVQRLLEISEVALRLRPLVSGRPDRRVRAGDRRADLHRELWDLLRLRGLAPGARDWGGGAGGGVETVAFPTGTFEGLPRDQCADSDRTSGSGHAGDPGIHPGKSHDSG